MRKKILIIFGSPNENGKTSKVLKIINKKLAHYCDFYVLDSHKEKIKPCTGCRKCDKKIMCKFEDFANLRRFLENKDFIIVASPIYNMGVPSALKAVFDRFQPYFASRFLRRENLIKPNKALVLLTSGGNDSLGILCTKLQIKTALSSINTNVISEIVCENTDKDFVLCEELLKKVTMGVKEIEKEIKN